MNADMLEEHLNGILKGRMFKKMLDVCFTDLRERYGLKQIEVEILLFLDLYPDSHASDIHKNLLLNKGQVSKTLENLCAKNLLCVKPDPDDGRAVCYELLSNGLQVIGDCKKKREDMSRCLLEGITEEELRVMSEVAGKIETNIIRYCGP